MWLIDAATLELVEFIEPPVKYAILSHVWEKEEVSFKDMLKRQDQIQNKAGFHKIQNCCRIAKERYNLEYLWIDTCCIDKRSSAELSEAINSMFKWYQCSTVCIVYLYDVPGMSSTMNAKQQLYELEDSRWFTRGWTLQEAIAPSTKAFYAGDWSSIADNVKYSECSEQVFQAVSDVSGIPLSLLLGWQYWDWKDQRNLDGMQDDDLSTESSEIGHESWVEDFSIAERMSWAANRSTTRPEDMAYSLLGIFGVSMPILYGEGAKRAFYRLQNEIINTNPRDQSIFAWRTDDTIRPYSYTGGLLARSVKDFRKSTRVSLPSVVHEISTPSVTGLGVLFRVQLVTLTHCPALLNQIHDASIATTDIDRLVVAIIQCSDRDDHEMDDTTCLDKPPTKLGLYLRRTFGPVNFVLNERDVPAYHRVCPTSWAIIESYPPDQAPYTQILVLHDE